METDEHTRVDPTRNPPLAGRDRELDRLGEALDRALSGHGSLVLISGEAGIGKTALVKALIAEAREQDALVLSGAAYDLTATPPYGPWLDLLDRYPQFPDLPSLPDVLKPGTGPAEVRSRQALFTMLRDFLSSVARIRPLLLVLEDLHWADQASLDLLRYLARQIAEHRILLVATYRDDEVSRQHPLFQLLPLIVREADTQRLELQPLNEYAVRSVVQDRWVLENDDQIRLVEHLLTRAEGNPLFTIEIARSLEQHGHLKETDGNWHLDDLSQFPVPTLVQQVIETRVARLGEDARFPLDVAAVIGQQVPLDIWQCVAHLSDDQLIDVLSQATSWHLLEPTPDRGQMQFVHALTREALYESILLPRRRDLHRQVAETLSATEYPDPDAVAHHFQRSGDERAVEWLLRAGERAFESHAWVTAADRFEQALNLISNVPERVLERARLHYQVGHLRRFAEPARGIVDLEVASRLARENGEEALAANASMEIGLLHCLSGNIRRGLAQMQAARIEVESLPPSGWLSEHSFYGSSERSIGMFFIWQGAVGPYSQTIELGERSRADAGPDLTGVSWGLGWAYAGAGRPAEAYAAFELARNGLLERDDVMAAGLATFSLLTEVDLPYYTDLLDERHRLSKLVHEDWERAIGGFLEGFSPRVVFVDELILQGDWREAREILTSTPYAFSMWGQYTASRLGWLERQQGNPDAALIHVQRILPDGTDTLPGDCFFSYVIRLVRLAAELALDQEDLEAARAWITAHRRWLDWSGAEFGRVDEQLLWGRLHWVAGEQGRAHAHGVEALRLAAQPRQPLGLVEAFRFLGELETESGGYSEAEAHLHESLRLTRACKAPFERARTLLAMAELDAARKNRSGASAYLTEARLICTELGARPTLERAEALRTRSHPRVTDNEFGLSPRELEVLGLVTQGKSDREIADELFISPRTVMQHVSSILRKLNVESRTAAATVAVRNGLI